MHNLNNIILAVHNIELTGQLYIPDTNNPHSHFITPRLLSNFTLNLPIFQHTVFSQPFSLHSTHPFSSTPFTPQPFTQLTHFQHTVFSPTPPLNSPIFQHSVFSLVQVGVARVTCTCSTTAPNCSSRSARSSTGSTLYSIARGTCHVTSSSVSHWLLLPPGSGIRYEVQRYEP